MAKTLPFLLTIIFLFANRAQAQNHSTARQWNELTLYAISADFARPTVHARNLFHLSIAMYDAWMAYEPGGNTYLLGKSLGNYDSKFDGIVIPPDIESARQEAISYAAYRLIEHRYDQSPGIVAISDSIQSFMNDLGYDVNNQSVDYVNGGPAELGNYIASEVIAFGYTDGSNEAGNYGNSYYEPVNPPIEVEEPGNPDIIFPNRWQQISLSESIDQSGEIVENAPPFLSPEWGDVLPFAMDENDRVVKSRDGHDYLVYKDPGEPALIDTTDPSGLESFYKWNFALVPIWQSHLDTSDNVIWDVSPNSIGNVQSYPENWEDYASFYNFINGGDPGIGYEINPISGEPYEVQEIRRADYARVLAEFWADGPESVTPPGHWFKIYNEVSDHPLFERNWEGQGAELDPLEYDVRAYLTIGGAMHDAAITAWSIKGYYDYLRPVSAVRFMADKGQCTDPDLPNYHPAGLPLIAGYIELVQIDDPLAGLANQHAGKIKLYTWRGPDYIGDPDSDEAGVGWILAENWWPYQRPSFVTPPFAGYISGHSTYSRTAAEVMTLMTGSKYFPGGMSGFVVEQDEFLVFEDGPSETFQLQWATYRDASDQCSLSRIWGGIHPPIDDIPGRKIGIELGPQCFNFANDIIQQNRPFVQLATQNFSEINIEEIGNSLTILIEFNQEMDQSIDPSLEFFDQEINNILSLQSSGWQTETEYRYTFVVNDYEIDNTIASYTISQARSLSGVVQNPYLVFDQLTIDTQKPEVVEVIFSAQTLNDQLADAEYFTLEINFNEACDTSTNPQIVYQASSDISSSLVISELESNWQSPSSFLAVYDILDNELEADNIVIEINAVIDLLGNQLVDFENQTEVILDTKNPELTNYAISQETVNIGTSNLTISFQFSEAMDTNIQPEIGFSDQELLDNILTPIEFSTEWISDSIYEVEYEIENYSLESNDIDIYLTNFKDVNNNPLEENALESVFDIDTKRPMVIDIIPESDIVSDNFIESGFNIEVHFSEAMDMSQNALVLLDGENVGSSIQNDFLSSEWISETTFLAHFGITDENVEIEGVDLSVQFAKDFNGNNQEDYEIDEIIDVDTKNPSVISVTSSDYFIDINDVGLNAFEILVVFDEAMNELSIPLLMFEPNSPVNSILSVNLSESGWINQFAYKTSYDVSESDELISGIDIIISDASDAAFNGMSEISDVDFLIIDMQSLGLSEAMSSDDISVYPSLIRPGESLKIRSGKDFYDFSFSLKSISGQLVFSFNGNLASGENLVQLPVFSSGLYIYEITTNEKDVYNGKLVVSGH